MQTHKVKLGLIQRASETSTDANLAGTISAITEAADAGAQIICTQELFLSDYFCQSQDTENFNLAHHFSNLPNKISLHENVQYLSCLQNSQQ